MTHEELLERIKNLNVSLIEDMSSDSLALLTEGFSEPLVRAIMCRTQDNYEQKKIFTKIKSSYKRWKEDTDFLWGPMPQMEVYPDYMDKMQLDVESGMIITEDGSIPAPPKKPFKAPYAPGLGSMFQEIYGKTQKTHPASTDNPPIKEIVYNISTKKPTQTQETSQLQARIAELEAENASLRKQLEEERQKNQGIEVLGAGNDEWIVELLAHLCYGDEQIARDILDEIRGKEDPVIADIIFERKQKNQISPKTQNRELWKILHAAKLYRGIEGNFNTALRRRQQR